MHVRQRSCATAEAARDVQPRDVKWFDLSDDAPSTGWTAVVKHRGKTLFLLLLASVVLICYIRRAPAAEEEFASIAPNLAAATVENTTVPPANLHLLVPASKGDANLCKVLVSASILGYPSPIIVNWNQSFNQNLVAGGSHLAKIGGIHDQLNRFHATQDEDLVLMVDGYDIWFQLRPQTLIDRYFAINQRADKRTNERLKRAAVQHNIRQEIVFGCQKRCWPWSENDPPCYAVPQSDLPDDIYGPQTDTDIGDVEDPYIKFRPRFLNSGVAIGTVRAMRKLFGQALKNMEHEKNFGSDQFIFSHIFGDQELWREAIRQDSLTGPEKMDERVIGLKPKVDFRPGHVKEVRKKAAQTEDGNYEFGIGVDFRSEIGLNTVFAEDDTAWLTWSNTTRKLEAEQGLNITSEASRLQNLSSDIVDTIPPFWTFNHEPSLPRWTKWPDVRLFTNVWHGNVPAVIHHNAHRDGRKALRTQWWDKIWFFEHARTLYDMSVYEPIVPIAYSGYNAESQRAWWPGERWKGGGRNGPKIDGAFDEQWVGFAEMCHEFHEEVFRDGKGPWILPQAH
ncbi:hypothetical protein DOTSEDRAFT_53590 [Dothistroma septosporum NZE10]|uniref:Uncharacterized protein n=1 Tax=Dothistroma septosporum (strain NZE10 / CBS 128990) TaxID=675120 RepID=N1PQ56_DOTSN|nr:hypothetical protein DOTSEDRAFT_53590 [Dothistroma septosporum NZE10]